MLDEQKAYYDARAGEYDEWWERRGRYDLGLEGNTLWQQEIRTVQKVFDQAPLRGSILEIAAGTGNWTLYLARRADRVLVLEQSSAMIERNRQRLRAAGLETRVLYEQVDALYWKPRDRYDCVFFAFWLAHLPASMIDTFLLVLASALKPGGCLAILEGKPGGPPRNPKQNTHRLDDDIELRTLNDGRTFRVINRLRTPKDIAMHLMQAGLQAHVGATENQFVYTLAFAPTHPEA